MANSAGTVEIAGGGIGGLGAAILFAQRGWKVRVHERNDVIREVGAGIYLRNNPLTVLEELGIADRIRSHGLPLERALYRDGSGKVLQDLPLVGEQRLLMAPRHVVIEALEQRAREVGVEISLGSRVMGADPRGELILDGGRRLAADLVVGADGQLSRVRNSLGLLRRRKELDSVATRFVIDNRDFEPHARTTMYWSGNRRVGVAACGDAQTYVFMISTKRDRLGLQRPIDAESWSASFPVLAPMMTELAGLPSIQHPFVLVRTKHWRSGRAAIIGDAAHGLPPLLGQGAGLALSNAWALAHTVAARGKDDVPEALAEWERVYRPYTQTTQNWSVGLDVMTRLWPHSLISLRERLLIAIGRSRTLQGSMRAADAFPIEIDQTTA